MSTPERRNQLIVVRGGGDLATGVIHRLHRCGWPVLVLEVARPSAIRRKVAFCEAVYDGAATVEGVTCRRADDWESALSLLKSGEPVLLIDPDCETLRRIRPWALVDAIIAKRNLGTSRGMADRTIALGPGFEAGRDVDVVIETRRGHNLGRLILQGSAAPNTGVPGIIAGYGAERVIHAPAEGRIHTLCAIGDVVEKGQRIAEIGDKPVLATLTGVLRGLIRDGYPVTKGFKIADIDPRLSEQQNCFTISDKSRALGGSVLEALLMLEARSWKQPTEGSL